MSEEILDDAARRMDKAVDAFASSIATIRTGRAHTALVEHLPVSHYGQTLPLNQLATLAAPDAQLITVQPWDRGAVDPIVRAIQQSDLGINPASDGVVIRLPIPPLTEERRRELVRQLGGKLEDSRVAVRNVRRHAVEGLRRELRAGDSLGGRGAPRDRATRAHHAGARRGAAAAIGGEGARAAGGMSAAPGSRRRGRTVRAGQLGSGGRAW